MQGWSLVAVTLLAVWAAYTTGDRGGREEGFYTNSWAVEVSGGPTVADYVARRHGFINLGQAGSLKDIYHFVHAFSPSRSRRSLDEPHQSLVSDSLVVFAEQQVAKQRVKRDYHPPANTMWSKQWYLHRDSHHDMNVEMAWEFGATGKGVVVSILDDGIEHTHPDLKENYDPMASYDFNSHDNDPFPRYDITNENKHGTRCAGEVAAERDGKCGTGAAFLASIGGVRMLDGSVTDVVESSSLHLNPQHIDIYSSSWGPSDNGQTVDGPGMLAKRAFVDGVTLGRGGLGSIYVWAAGNGGREGDSCNCDGYAVSPYTISVGSVSQNDLFPWYAEVCSSTLSSTYSSGSGAEKQIVSTDLHHKCTERHTGTSASAPLAAGIMALALETNHNLTWRDMQYLVIYSSNPAYPKSGEFHANGAGLKVSHRYGFGVLDAGTIVNRARWWITAPPRENCTVSVDVSKAGKATQSSPLEVTIDTTSCHITYLEHVQAITTLQMDKGHRKSIEITLLSPMGTSSTLLPHRQHDFHTDGFHEWPFMTVHSWGENPSGNWLFRVHVDWQNTEASLHKLTLVLYGTREMPRSIRNVPSQCHPECVGGCAGDGAKFCDKCKHVRMAETMECVLKCPDGTYKDHHMCRACPSLCSRCTSGSSCLECTKGSVVLSSTGECSLSCEPFSFQALNGSCLPCHHSCVECEGPRESDCTLCPPQFLRGTDGRCTVPPSCEAGQYFDSRSLECRPCHSSCAECVGKGAKECTECYSGSSLDEGVCVVSASRSKQCAKGEFFLEDDHSCRPCSTNCTRCTDEITCLSCDPAHYLWTERVGDSQVEVTTCINECPKGFHGDAASLSCQSCPSYCTECDDHDKCTSCSLEFATPVDGQCPQPCHDGQYFDFSTSHCLLCLDGCLTCRDPHTCLACHPELYLISDAACVSACPEHLVGDEDTHACLSETCHDSCLMCFGEEPDQCLSCPEGAKLMEHACMEECPEHTYYDEKYLSCKHCHKSCQSCAGPSQENCLSCPKERYLDHFACVSSCPDSTFVLNSTECVSCLENCVQCSSAEHCTRCSKGLLMEEGKCVRSCSEGFLVSDEECQRCLTGCKSCSDLISCETCLSGLLYYKPNRSCLQSCPAGYFPARGSCSECHEVCSECTGPDSSQCTMCGRDRAMEEKTRTCTLCCNPDIPDRAPCCDCDANSTSCVLLATPPTTPLTHRGLSKEKTSDLHATGLAVILVIIALIGAIMTGIALFYVATRILRQRGISYTPLNSKRGDMSATLALVEESESGSEAELFAKISDT